MYIIFNNFWSSYDFNFVACFVSFNIYITIFFKENLCQIDLSLEVLIFGPRNFFLFKINLHLNHISLLIFFNFISPIPHMESSTIVIIAGRLLLIINWLVLEEGLSCYSNHHTTSRSISRMNFKFNYCFPHLFHWGFGK